MNLKHLLLLSALLMICVRSAPAQPTCSSYFDAFKVCSNHYLQSEYVFLGRVVALQTIPSPMKGYSGEWQHAIVAVDTLIKGQVDRKVALTLDGRCFGSVSKNSKYMFIADKYMFATELGGEEAGLISRKWSLPLDETSADRIAQLTNQIREVLRGVPEPRLFGTVTELVRSLNVSQVQRHPLPGVVVVVEDKAGKRIVARTNDEGIYTFDRLPIGTYAVYPILSKKMDLYVSTSYGISLQKEEKQSVRIVKELCGVQVDFDEEQTGSINARMEREAGDWKGPPHLNLFRAENGVDGFQYHAATWRDFSYGYLKPSYIRPEAGAGTKFDVGFEHVPVGTYILRYTGDPRPELTPLLYPAVRSLQNAKLIKVEAGKRTDIVIRVPFFREWRVFGQTMLSDGNPVAATIQVIDEIEPNATIENAAAPDGQFQFRFWGDRPFTLYAYYVGKKDGKVVRYFARTKRLILERDLGPVTIKLDQIEPY